MLTVLRAVGVCRGVGVDAGSGPVTGRRIVVAVGLERAGTLWGGMTGTERAPRLVLLGWPRIDGAAGTPPAQNQALCVEMLAYLVEHPGATGPALDADLRVTPATRRTALSRLRGWLGRDAEGRLFAPMAYSGRVRLHPGVGSDWQEFQALAGPRATTGQLVEALGLVEGRPVGGLLAQDWPWALPLQARIVDAVRQVGGRVAQRATVEGDCGLASWALRHTARVVGGPATGPEAGGWEWVPAITASEAVLPGAARRPSSPAW